MTVIDFRANPATARAYRVVSLVTHADIPDIVWADDETGCYTVRGRDANCNRIVVERSGADQDRQREEVTMPDRDNAELWERTIGCRRMKGYVHSSRTPRSAKSPLPTRS